MCRCFVVVCRLEPDTRDKMIQLLTLEEDFDRILRVPGDTFCTMFIEIILGRRKIKCDEEFAINK